MSEGLLAPSVLDMKILFASSRGLGHVYPLLPLARAARSAGDDVLFAVPASVAEEVRRRGYPVAVTTTAAPESGSPPATPSADPSPPPDPVLSAIRDYWGGAVVRAELPPLRRIVASWRPDVVVSEVMNLAGPLAAEAAGIPHVPLGVNALRVDHVGLDVVAEPLNDVRHRLGLPQTPDIGWLFRYLYATPFPGFLEHPELERPPTTFTYRHADPDGYTPAPTDGGRRHASGRPTVYASLGTKASEDDTQIDAHRTALAALGLVDADVVFTVGGVDRSKLGLVPANVRLAGDLPPTVSMQCDVVLTHAGAGTTTAALSRGLPLVCLPLFGDQPHNAARVAALGAGVLADVAAGPRALAGAVEDVLATPSYAAEARSLAWTMAESPAVESVVPLLHEVADAGRLEEAAS